VSYEAVAKAHHAAAEHHGKGSHETAHERSTKAHTQPEAARTHSIAGHGKSVQHGKK
jgi:hypothetical protein